MTPAIETLARLLPTTLPAHTVHGSFEHAPDCDYIYVQGRQDRLHTFWLLDNQRPDDARQAAASSPTNWFWLVTSDATPDAATIALAQTLKAGILSLQTNALSICRPSPPRPGIHIRSYDLLRREWKNLSDF
jgi:hypothetical protein